MDIPDRGAALGIGRAKFLGNPANASMKGVSAFGMFYFPVPIIDLYLKAGIARIQSALSGLAPVFFWIHS